MAVSADVSVVNAIAGNAIRFFDILTVNSVAKCCASAGDERADGCSRASALSSLIKITNDFYAMIFQKDTRLNSSNFFKKSHTRFFSNGSHAHVRAEQVSVG